MMVSLTPRESIAVVWLDFDNGRVTDHRGGVDDSWPQLDMDALTAAVRVALGRPEATVERWQAEPLRGLGFGAAIHRVSGVASQGGVRAPWSVIRKQVRDAGDGPADFSYWRREPLAYAGGLLAELAGVAAPRCFAQGEEACGVVLWLEDLADGDRGGWTVEHYGLVARGLGLLGGAYAGGWPVPHWPWLSQEFLGSWVEQRLRASRSSRKRCVIRCWPTCIRRTWQRSWWGCGGLAGASARSWPAGRRCSATWTRCRRT